MNLGTFMLSGDGYATLGNARIRLSEATHNAITADDHAQIVIGFRPEALEIVEPGDNTIPIKIEVVEELGSDSYIYGHLHGGGDLGSGTDTNPDKESTDKIIIRAEPHTAPSVGSVVHVRIKPGGQHNFSKATGLRLPD